MIVQRRGLLGGMAAGWAAGLAGRAWAAAPAPRKGGVLKVSAFSDMTSFDPATGRSGDDHIVLYTLYDTLIDYDFDSLEARPNLATAWSFPDPKTLVLQLRQGVQFHDGTPFDATAVKFNLDRIRQLPRSTIRADVASVDTVEVVSQSEVRLHLKQPDTALPLILSDRAGMMVSPTAAQKYGDALDRNPVGTGAMRFVQWRDGERTIVGRNEKYWKPNRPYLDGINFAVMPELQTGLRSLLSGENSFIYALSPQQLSVAKRSSRLVPVVSPTLLCQLLYFNLGTPPLDDVRVRQAVNYAIDRNAFGKATGGLYTVADMLLPTEHWAYDKALTGRYPYDVDRARRLLTDAGHPDGVDLQWFTYDDQAWQQRAEVLIEQLKAARIRVHLTSASNAEVTSRFFQQKAGNVNLSSWSGRPDPSLTYSLMFGSETFFNPGHGITPGLDEALAATRVSDALSERAKAFATVQKIVLDNALFAPLMFQPQIVVHATEVNGYRPTLLGKPRFDDVFLTA
jgi:ABC-type transport system substrate-binding protein